MLTRRIVFTLLMTGSIAISPTVTQAQSTGVERQGTSQESPSNQRMIASVDTAIVGSWMGTVGSGERAINSFTSDGLMLGSVQGEVSLSLGEVLTAIHGVWTHLAGQRFAVTTTGLLYDIQTGELHGFVKIHVLLRVDASGDRMTGTDRVEIFGPDGYLVDSFPPGPVQFTRIKNEPFN